MDIGTLIFLAIVAILFYYGWKRWQQPSTDEQYQQARRQRLAVRDNVQHFLDSANILIRQGKYDEASTLFLQAGRIFQAAKTKMLKGPQAAPEAIEIIRNRMPLQVEKIGRNLAHEFYYNLNRPREAAAILRAMGLHGEAEAIEVVAGITSQSTPEPISQTPSSKVNPVQVAQSAPEPVSIPEPTSSPPSEEVIAEPPEKPENIPNLVMTATSNLSETCVVCRKAIRNGDEYIYCVHCGKPGHSRHLFEYMKVKGECPNCKQRLRAKMYQT
ncbi:MAG: hypothetical protein D6732_09655 [Methanobacteriota archaeon]|nr:MAG: hypothetical protein D6732_09655 [Euryarchaeota archaeon]